MSSGSEDEMSEIETPNMRKQMKKFWKRHSVNATTEEMMLDSDAQNYSGRESEEILSLLPNFEGKQVLELGAGIGRFTGEIAKTADSVVAVDFMDNFVQKNKLLNSHYGNIEFLQADVTKLKLEKDSFDVVFSNWLLMYLSEEEVFNLMQNVMSWLKLDGHFFFRESCYHKAVQIGTNIVGENPTQYRAPSMYNKMMLFVTEDNEDSTYGFSLVMNKSVDTYIELKNNPNQLVWLMQKTEVAGEIPHGYKSFQEFLDKQQYSRNGILRYEKIFGRNYVSAGGRETTEEFVKLLDLNQGQKVIDVGCGIGGSAFHMAQQYGVSVHGIDLSSNMIEIARERLMEQQERMVTFEVADATTREYLDGQFDIVYSRDTILHIADKKALFQRFLTWLKPGGKLLISDYCCGDGKWSDKFTKYVEQRGYQLLSPDQYGKVLEDAGFVKVNAMDKSSMFIDVLKREVAKTEGMKEEYIKEFSQEDYDAIINGWKDKIERVTMGDQKWGLFYAEKAV